MFSASRNGNGRPARRFLPNLETLEDRWCPSGFGDSHLAGDSEHHWPGLFRESRSGDENDRENHNGPGQNNNNQGDDNDDDDNGRGQGQTLVIRGTNGDDTVTIQDDGMGGITAVLTRSDGTTQTFTGTNVRNLIVDTRGGNDTVTFTQNGP